MDVISLSILLEYLYRKFMVTFILCLIGATIRESLNTVKLTKINVKKLLASVVVASVIMCAVVDYVRIPFSIYTVACIIFGIWSPTILKFIMHSKFMALLLSKIFKRVGDPVIKAAIDTMDEMNKSQDESTDGKDEETTKIKNTNDDS